MKIINDSVTAPQGFTAQGVEAEIKKDNKRKDVAVIYSVKPGTAAGVFTTNKVHAACIDINRKHLENGCAQAIVANSGNANACTGWQGYADTITMAESTGECLGINPHDVLVASTGVIGVPIPMDRIIKGILEATGSLQPDGGHDAAQAIMTTDLVPKEIAVEFELDGKPCRIGAIAKGSGMIHPNLATMLCFITTDTAISHACLQQMLQASVEKSFNMISVDRDMSTNDMVLVLANGLAGNKTIDDISSYSFSAMQQAMDEVTTNLAKKIARDGEGATRMIQVEVLNAPDKSAAKTIARSITASNLTKAAVFGEDANWGRILAAAGYSGAEFDPELVDIYLGTEKMAENGTGLTFNEASARAELQKDPVIIKVDMKAGTESAVAWGCDLTYDYIRINAAYRT